MKKSTRLILFFCAMVMCVCFGYVLGVSSDAPPDLPEVCYVETPNPAQTPYKFGENKLTDEGRKLLGEKAPSTNITVRLNQRTATPSPTAPVYYYAASRSSDKFHELSCYYVDNILPENVIYFETRGDALEAGKEPCSRCNP